MSKQAGIVREDEGHRRASRTRDHGVWTESFRVHSYEVDARGTTPIHTICNYLQETAGNHARALGVSAESMPARGLAWVLGHLAVNIERETRWGHTLSVETWHSGVNGLRTTREFVLRDHVGRRVGRATSTWRIIDLDRRRITRPPADLIAVEACRRGRVIRDASAPATDALGALGESPDAADHHQVVTVRDSDLGLNRHVNAARYAAWAVEALPPSIRTDRRLARLELRFCAESTRGDTIATDAQGEDGTRAHAASSLDVLHRLSRVEEDQTLAMARSRWTHRPASTG